MICYKDDMMFPAQLSYYNGTLSNQIKFYENENWMKKESVIAVLEYDLIFC